MRAPAGILLAVLLAGPAPAAPADVAVTLAARAVPGSCDVVSTATIVAYDLPARQVRYRFVRSDGSASPVETVALGGDGAVARSVEDRWSPRGASPWVALRILSPHPLTSEHLAIAVAPHCAAPNLAQR